jgi:hypothetical protein
VNTPVAGASGTAGATQPSGGFLSTAMDKLSDPYVAIPVGLSLLSSKPQPQQ